MYRATPKDGIAFVTGGSSGIGRVTALELARRGYRVAVTARRAGAPKESATIAPQQIVAYHRDATRRAATAPQPTFAYPGAVTRRAEVKAIVAVIEPDLGPIALAFLNAGVFLSA